MQNTHRLAQIKWNCRRGMLELDIILKRYVESQLSTLSEEALATFERLLTHPDPDLYAWFMGYEKPEDETLRDCIESIRNHHSTSVL